MVDLINGNKTEMSIDTKSDIWALGCLFFKTCFSVDAFESALGISNQRFFFPTTPYRSEAIKDLISSIFVQANKRPNIHKIISDICRIGNIHVPTIQTKPNDTHHSTTPKTPKKTNSVAYPAKSC